MAFRLTIFLIATSIAHGSEKPSCTGFSKGDFSGDVTDKAICRTACEKAEGFCCPDFKGEAGKAKCSCRNKDSGTNIEYRGLCQDADYVEPEPADPCFHGDDTVILEVGGTRKLKDVRIGDRILTADAAGNHSFSDVVFLPHDVNERESTFVEVMLRSGKSVHPTPYHLLKTCSGGLVWAKFLTAGACLDTVDGQDYVRTTRKVRGRGVYTAVAMHEFIIVNGIVASPFAFLHQLPSTYYNVHRWIYKAFPSLLVAPAIVHANDLIGRAAVASLAIGLPSLKSGSISDVLS